MKKIYAILCAAVIALSASAAPVQDMAKAEKKAPAKAIVGLKNLALVDLKAAPARVSKAVADNEITFTITADSITTTGAKIAVTPSESTTYYWELFPKAMADTMTDAAVADYFMEIFDSYGNYYGVETSVILPYLLLSDADSYVFETLTPSTAYTVVALQLDENGELVAGGASARYDFSTLDVVLTGDTTYVTINNLKWADYTAEQGWWQIYGVNADSTYSVSFSNYSTVSVAAGTYDYADMDPDYTYLKTVDGEVAFVSGEIVVSENGDGTYHLVATLLATDGTVYVLTLDSKLPTVSENVITLTYDAATRSVNITTTNSDPYFFYLETQADYAKYESDYTQESLLEEIDAWVYTLAQYGYVSYYTFSGNTTISMVDFMGSYAATDDYIAFAAPIEDGDLNGAASYVLFHFDYPEAIENTNAAVKAVKTLRNGQLIIEKGNKTFNVLGAEVK